MISRPLHAVAIPPGGRFTELLAGALDGTGPAILPLDPALPAARLRELAEGFGAAAIETPAGPQPLPPGTPAAPLSAGPDTAVIITTSGSTGLPKGVRLSAAALRASAAASLARLGAAPGSRWLCCLPAFHVAGLQVLIRSMLAGTDPVLAGRLDPAVVAGSGCRYVSLVPTQLRRLLDAGAPLDAFDAILLGGAAAPAALLAEARAAGARPVTTYGMSETCGGCVYDGLPLDGVRVATDRDGRIGIAGPVLFSGYWANLRPGTGDGSGTAGGGWFWTSDLGELDSAGRLTVRGRADDVINTGGEKVIPGEVETVLGTIGGVRDVVVIGTADPEWGEIVTAVIVPDDPAAPPELARLREQARGRLPRHAAPRRLIVAERIPLLGSGKPDRAAVRELAADATAGGGGASGTASA